MKKLLNEFKEFISRGNVVDMSVGVIIGGAFSSIVTALTDKIVMPLVNFVLAKMGGAKGLESAYTILSPGYTDDVLDLSKSVYIDWGAFISAILNFLIIAIVIFTIVKVINASRKRIDGLNGRVKANLDRNIIEEKKALKIQAKKSGRKFKELWKEHEERMQKLEAEAKEKEEKEKETEANKKPDDILLLESIKEELIKLNKKNK